MIGDKIEALVGALQLLDMTLSREAAALGVVTFADGLGWRRPQSVPGSFKAHLIPSWSSSPLTVTSRLQPVMGEQIPSVVPHREP